MPVQSKKATWRKKEYGKECPKCKSLNTCRFHGKKNWHCYHCGNVWSTEDFPTTIKMNINPNESDEFGSHVVDMYIKREGICPIANDLAKKEKNIFEKTISRCPFMKDCIREDKGVYKYCKREKNDVVR